MKKIATLILLLCLSNAQSIDINALRMAQSKFNTGKSHQGSREEINQSRDKTILDATINPNMYMIGPGDVFRINIISSDDISMYSLVVSPSGNILIPSFGIINVNGISLKESLKKLKELVNDVNPAAKVHIQLSELREFNIKVIGHLDKPGLYTTNGASRISSIYDQIIYDQHENQKLNDEDIDKNQLKDSKDYKSKNEDYLNYIESDYNPQLSKRNIKLIRDGDTLNIDLTKFKISGDDIYNPYIHQGDILVLPFKKESIYIFGGIQIPGEYEYKSNENLKQLIEIAGGFKSNKNISNIEVTRLDNFVVNRRFSLNIDDIDSLILKPLDRIMVQYNNNHNRQEQIQITGEVKYPGTYSIDYGSTTIRDILDRSGGYTDKADKSKLYINNQSIAMIPDYEQERILFIDENSRSYEEKAYIKARFITSKGMIKTTSMDQLKDLLNYRISKDDIIHIPEVQDFIEIVGGVKHPGRYPHYEGFKIEEYIKKAGGKTKRASRKKYVIKSGTGQRLPYVSQTIINKGDVIFVPEKEEVNSWQLFKDILSTAGSIGTLIILIQNVGQN